MRVATQAAATDPRTGTIDIDLISTGRSQLDRDNTLKLAELLREMLFPSSWNENMKGQRMTLGQVRQAILRQLVATPEGEREDKISPPVINTPINYCRNAEDGIVRL